MKMKDGEARIIILIRNGNVLTKRELGKLMTRDLAQLIVNIELLVEDLKGDFKKRVRRFKGK